MLRANYQLTVIRLPALRLYPTAPGIGRHSKSKEDTFIAGGRYRIRPSDVVVFSFSNLHRDPKVLLMKENKLLEFETPANLFPFCASGLG